MQKALSSDLKTAAAPAPKKYPPQPPCPNFKKYPSLPSRANFREISVSPTVSETFGKYPLARRTQTSKNIRPFRAERTFGKYTSRSHFPKFAENIRLAHRDRNFREISSRPPYPKLSEISPSPAYPKLSKKHTLARRAREQNFSHFVYVITNSYYIIPYPPCFDARREL